MWNWRDQIIKRLMVGAVLALVAVAVLCLVWLPFAHAVTTQSVKLIVNATAAQNCTVVTDCPVVDVKGYTTIVFQVLGTFSGSVQFEAAIDKNLGFTSLECFNTANRSSSTTSTQVAGSWRCNVIGFNYARPRIDVQNSGTITVLAGVVSAGVL